MKVRVTENHDWLRVVANESKTRKLSLTVSRRGETCSGAGIDPAPLRKALGLFGRFLAQKSTGDYLEKIKSLEKIALESDTLDQYVEKMVVLAG